MDKKTSTKGLIGQNEQGVMAEDPAQDMPVKPQQLIGGINGLILQLHKMNAKLEESRHNHEEQTEKMKRIENKNQNLKEEIDDLKNTKERLSEQSQFLEKSLKKKKQENEELIERLKEAEIQLGESGSVLDTVRNLESKNEMLNVKMSTIVLNTEEEIAKVISERDHYLKLLEEVDQLNERNTIMHQTLEKEAILCQQDHENAKKLVQKAKKTNTEIAKTLEEISLAKNKYLKLIEEQQGLEKNNKENSIALEQENEELKKKMKEFEARYGGLGRNIKEIRINNEMLKEELLKSQEEKNELEKEVNSLKNQLEAASQLAIKHTASMEKAQQSKQYEILKQQIQMMVESCGKTAEKLENLQESVDESKDLLKGNIKGIEQHNNELNETNNSCETSFNQEYFEVVVEMQDVLKHLQIRDEELANLEKLAGLPEQRECEGVCGIVGSIRGLVAMKDTQIRTLEEERTEIVKEVDEIKKNCYKQAYLMEEMQKEKDGILEKMTLCQEKYRLVKDEKENLRKDLLVKNTAEKITETYIGKLKEENAQFKNLLQKHQTTFKQKFSVMKNDFDQKLAEKDLLVNDMKNKLNACQHEKEKVKNEMDSLLQKDTIIKEKIISIFTK